ncbi:hypothetical protein [Microvirga yunnanensis]|uniref:hypothetical protein n=1 Tax=Microvirga yunnanensis TaxID=2953740 RepID=UPI0021C9F8E9|nr:hypothetical protein [Microvirga sp. HBU67655]
MFSKHVACLILVTGALGTMTISAPAQDAGAKPPLPTKAIGRVTPTGPVPSLAVLNAAGAKLEGNRLTLTGVSPSSIVFADRPVRAAGHVMTQQFIMQWDEGKDSFAKDPPNATVSVLGGDGSQVSDAVVTLKAPKLEGGTLTFDVAVLEGNLNGASGPAALFIDWFAGEYGRARSAYWHAPVYHGAWYGRSGVSTASAAYAAENSAVIPNVCGYYPYSPCGNE